MYIQTEKIDQIIPALVAFNMEFNDVSIVPDKKNETLRNRYVTLDNMLRSIRPILAKNGLVIVQALSGDHLVTTIYHSSGQYIQSQMPFSPMAGNRGTNNLQELGGGITYAKRYALAAMLSISVDNDDDAQSAGNIKKEHLQQKQQQQQQPKPKKEVKSQEDLIKLAEWLNKNPNRYSDYEEIYLLTAEQKQFIEDNKQA